MNTRIFVGNLPLDIRESELQNLFSEYGNIRDIELKTPARPPAFAFIAFDDYRDAQDAIRGRNNYNFYGYRLRVEFSKSDRRGGADDRHANRTAGGGRSEHCVIVSNLPHGCSWQDLKGFMRKAGDVVFADVEKGGDGVVEFSNRDGAEYAIKSMDGTAFTSYSGTFIISVRAATTNKKRDRNDDDHEHYSSSSSRGKRIRSEGDSQVYSHSGSSGPSRGEDTAQASKLGSTHGIRVVNQQQQQQQHQQQHQQQQSQTHHQRSAESSSTRTQADRHHGGQSYIGPPSSTLIGPSAKDDTEGRKFKWFLQSTAVTEDLRLRVKPSKLYHETRENYEFFSSQDYYNMVQNDLPILISKGLYDDMGQPEANPVDKKYEAEYLAYKTMGEALRHTLPATRLHAALTAFYQEEWRQRGPTDSLHSRYFFTVAAPSGTGKTQTAFTLKSYEDLEVAHIVLSIEKRDDGRMSSKNKQSIYLHSCIFLPSLYLNEAISWDLSDMSTLPTLPDAGDFLYGAYTSWELHLVVALSRMFNLLDEESKPIKVVTQLRQKLWNKVSEKTALPVLVVDEALANGNASNVKRINYLRTVLRAVGIATVFMGTSLNVVSLVRDIAISSQSRDKYADHDMPWANVTTLLPRSYCTEREANALSEPGDDGAKGFLAALDLFAADKPDTAHSCNPFFLRCVWDAFLSASTRTVDEMRSEAAANVYRKKRFLRTVRGIRGQVQYCLGDSLHTRDQALITDHFARLTRDYLLVYEKGMKFLMQIGEEKRWCPVPSFPSPDADPVAPLLLGGVCTGTNHPPPFELHDRENIITLTSAMALILHRERTKELTKKHGIYMTNDRALSRSGDVLECIMTIAAVCASQASGVGGLCAKDFLLHFAAELLPCPPNQPLQWDSNTPLEGLWKNTQMIIPFCTGLSNPAYPTAILPNIGQYVRTENKEMIDASHNAADGSQVVTYEAKNHSSPITATTLNSISDKFLLQNAPLGIAVVSTLADIKVSVDNPDAYVIKLEVSADKKTLLIKPIGANDKKTKDFNPKNRILCVFECDEHKLLESFTDNGMLHVAYRNFTDV